MKASRYYLQPSLEALAFKNVSLAEKSFYLLQSRCPLLLELHIAFILSSSDTSPLVRLLQDCKYLKIIRLHYENCYSDYHLHAYVASRDDLRELWVQKFTEWKAIKKKIFFLKKKTVQNSFKDIQDLRLRLSSKAAAPLTAAITSVTHLTRFNMMRPWFCLQLVPWSTFIDLCVSCAIWIFQVQTSQH